MRLDKLLCDSGERTRAQSRRIIMAGRVTVNGQVMRDPGYPVSATQEVLLDASSITLTGHEYLLLHKPAGILTAARDAKQPTVMELLPPKYQKRGVSPVGRLDKDTTGALLLTDNGELNHRLLSPKRHVDKRYLASVDGPLTNEDVSAFREGLTLSDFTALPATLTILVSEPTQSTAQVVVREGKFHQIKRMFLARGRTVVSLHREAFGPIELGTLPVGQYRALSQDEVRALFTAAQMQYDKDKE